MTKAELIGAVQEKIDIQVSKKDLGIIIQGLFDVITEAVAKGDKVSVLGFGNFEAIERSARDCRNPKTGEIVHVEASKTPKFKASKAFKNAINE